MTNLFPHFIQALLNWCDENGKKTYLLCSTDNVQGLPEFAAKKNPEQINLSIGASASPEKTIDNKGVSFVTRFGGAETNLFVPLDAIIMVHSPESGVMVANSDFSAVDKPKDDDEIILAKPKSKLRIVE